MPTGLKGLEGIFLEDIHSFKRYDKEGDFIFAKYIPVCGMKWREETTIAHARGEALRRLNEAR